MTTLLEKRQGAAKAHLLKRKAAAEAYIKLHTERHHEKMLPYRTELEIVEKTLADMAQQDARNAE